MNINDAFLKLNLDKEQDIYDFKKLKKHYHFLALKYHPDKNDSIDNNKKFQEINQAYNILLDFYNNSDKDFNKCSKKTKFKKENEINYLRFEDLFHDFIGLLNIKNKEEIELIKKYFIHKYNYYNALILKKLSNNNYFKNLLNIFSKFDENYEKILIINTEIDNVLNNEVYKLELLEETLFIPLWYKEVIYNNYLIKIKIIKLDDKITIDLDNNIYINIKKNIQEILDNDIKFYIGTKEFVINNSLLYAKKNCNYKLSNCGIINPCYDVSDINELSNCKSHIFVNVTLV